MPESLLLLEVNQKIRLGVPAQEIDDYVSSYVAHIDDSRDTVGVARPPESLALARAGVGDTLMLCIVTESGIMRAETWITSLENEPLPIIYVHTPDGWERLQRRRYVRLRCSLGVTWVRVMEGAPLLSGHGTTVNLSAGGMKFRTIGRLNVGDMIEMHIDIPRDPLEALGRVARVEGFVEGRRERIYAIEFESLPDLDEDRVVAYVFSEQMRLRRDGLMN